VKKMKRTFYFMLAVVILAGIFVSACAQSANSPAAPATTAQTTTAAPTQTTVTAAATTATTATPQLGGTMKLIFFLSVVNLGYIPDYAAPYDTWIAESELQTLLAAKQDGSYGPMLATDYKIAPDYSSVTFTLRQGVKFHDGTDFNAQAVKYNLDLYNKGTSDTLRFISTVDVIDNYTVKVNMSKSQSGFMLNFAGRPGAMESPTALAANPKEYFLTHTVGTGPFQLTANVRDSHVDFGKVTNYYQQGKPYLDGIS
jgi:peptide/nickel transport system substrate-binding protein